MKFYAPLLLIICLSLTSYGALTEDERGVRHFVLDSRGNTPDNLKDSFNNLRSSNCTRVSITNTPLTFRNVKTLGDVLKKIEGLTVLDLNGNRLGSEGAAALVPVLKQMTGLESLDMGGNNLGPRGAAAALVPALGQKTGLNSLNLQDNNICPPGLAALVPVLQDLTSLTSLKLGGNGLGAKGVETLVPALEVMPRLEKLDLSNNNIPAEMQPIFRNKFPRIGILF